MDDIEWKFIQAFVNKVLKDGLTKEAALLEKYTEEARRYRYKVRKRLMREWVYKSIKEDSK